MLRALTKSCLRLEKAPPFVNRAGKRRDGGAPMWMTCRISVSVLGAPDAEVLFAGTLRLRCCTSAFVGSFPCGALFTLFIPMGLLVLVMRLLQQGVGLGRGWGGGVVRFHVEQVPRALALLLVLRLVTTSLLVCCLPPKPTFRDFLSVLEHPAPSLLSCFVSSFACSLFLLGWVCSVRA